MPKPRLLSEFICRELLFDYVSGELDPERHEAVKISLKEYPELQEQVSSIESAREFTRSLKKIQISEPLREHFENRPGTIEKAALNWKEVPTPLKWGAQGVLLALLITIAINLAPRFTKQDSKSGVILAEVTTQPSPSDPESQKVATSKDTLAKPSPDIAAVSGGSDADEVSVPATPVPKPAPVAAKKSASQDSEGSDEESSSETQDKSAKAGNGFVYRLFMTSSEVDKFTPQLTAKIVELGGEKAGEVELGWKRRSGSYYHFAMPENNYDSLVAFIKSHGPVRISKTAHKRVMPAGQIRIILWLEYNQGKKGSDEASSGAE